MIAGYIMPVGGGMSVTTFTVEQPCWEYQPLHDFIYHDLNYEWQPRQSISEWPFAAVENRAQALWG